MPRKATEKLTITHHFPSPGHEVRLKHIDLVSWIGVDRARELIKRAYKEEGIELPC